MSTSWDNARRRARALETALDAKVSSYSRLAATISRGAGAAASSSRDHLEEDDEGTGGYKLVEEEIEELLQKVCGYWAGSLAVRFTNNWLEKHFEDPALRFNFCSVPFGDSNSVIISCIVPPHAA